MKFAKELEEELVPEWRAKYFNYKLGKKKIKAIQRALLIAHKSPLTPIRRGLTPKSTFRDTFHERTPPQTQQRGIDDANPRPSATQDGQDTVPVALRRQSEPVVSSAHNEVHSTPAIAIPQPTRGTVDEYTDADGRPYTRYGSIIGSPPSPGLSRPATLTLPDPAIDPASENGRVSRSSAQDGTSTPPDFDVGPALDLQGSAFEVGKTRHPRRTQSSLSTRNLSLIPKSGPQSQRNPETPLLRRIFSHSRNKKARTPKFADIPLEARQEIDAKKSDFYEHLDNELDKIESFYKSKEEEATMRLNVLKEQLHALRDQRDEIEREANRIKEEQRHQRHKSSDEEDESHENRHYSIPGQLRNVDVLHPIRTAKQVHFGKIPKPNYLATPPDKALQKRKDYSRRPESPQISYKNAKRRLRTALQEYYRGLELLKAYALSNRTAFRKINKKYDKAVRPRTAMRYMSSKVNSAWFVKSTVIDNHISAVEDLYARYFEKGSHKLAVGKLRRKNQKPDAYDRSVFRNGLMLAAGTIFGLEGLVYGADMFYESEGLNPILAERTSFLLQFYAAYFLLVFLVLFFCLDCYIFSRAKVNYVFIFEFDTRHNLDWRQLSELPCLFTLMMGLTMWLNFSRVGGVDMYLWWPVILIAATVAIMFLPLPVLYWRSRRWFVYSCWRLVGAGIYPVEFRDFFLGDMFCSQTYTFGGIELFFCVYAHSWMNPSQCASSSSRLLGFLTTLPGMMRLFQCLRRYYDTRNIFPHLVNGGKYTFTILQYCSLSVFRVDKSDHTRAFFITCATINAIYCSIWDLVMDWSLLDPEAEHFLLRRQLAYKWWWGYYMAMVIDPILRFNWIFYAIPYFSDEIQHSALLGFLVSFSEVIRRGIWTIFRVENEHCTNVGRFRASRDVALPYKLESPATAGLDYTRKKKSPRVPPEEEEEESLDGAGMSSESVARSNARLPDLVKKDTHTSDPDTTLDPVHATGVDLERAETRESALSSLRRRQQQAATPKSTPGQSIRARVGSILHGAHAQDFERRKKHDEQDDGGSETESDAEEQDSDDDEAAYWDGPSSGRNGGTPGHSTGAGRPARAPGVLGQGGSEADHQDDDEDENAATAERVLQDQANSRQNRLDVQDARSLLRRARGDSS